MPADNSVGQWLQVDFDTIGRLFEVYVYTVYDCPDMGLDDFTDEAGYFNGVEVLYCQ